MLIATCHTDGCGNAGIPVPLDFLDPATPPDEIVCGPCGQQLTDVVTDEH